MSSRLKRGGLFRFGLFLQNLNMEIKKCILHFISLELIQKKNENYRKGKIKKCNLKRELCYCIPNPIAKTWVERMPVPLNLM